MAFAEDYLLARIRQKLQEDGVKLWLKPYFDETTNAATEEKLQVYENILDFMCAFIISYLT